MSSNNTTAWFAAAPEHQRPVLARLRKLIKASAPGVTEEIKWSRPCYSTERGLFCYLQTSKNHVTLGFQKGALLDDPRGVLEGSGKELRHVKIKDPAGMDDGAIGALLQQAARL